MTPLTTATLNNYGFNVYNKEKTLKEYLWQVWGYRLPVQEDYQWSDTEKKHIVVRPPQLAQKLLKQIKEIKGIWMFVSINDFDESWNDFLVENNLDKCIMYKSVPTRNYNYETRERLMTLYIMDFRNV